MTLESLQRKIFTKFVKIFSKIQHQSGSIFHQNVKVSLKGQEMEGLAAMEAFFPDFSQIPGSGSLPVPEVNFPGSRPPQK